MKHFSAKIFLTVYSLFCVMTLIAPFSVSADESSVGLFFRSSKSKVSVGDSITVDVLVRSPAVAINAISGTVVVPAGIVVDSISTSGSILTFWTKTPKGVTSIPFEGVVIGTPFTGKNGVVFHFTAHAKRAGSIQFHFENGSVLTGDGTARNILESLGTYSVAIAPATPSSIAIEKVPARDARVAVSTPFIQSPGVPYITSYTPLLDQSSSIILAGRGTPGAVTQIDFIDTSDSSLGKSIVRRFTRERVAPPSARIINGSDGAFSFQTPTNLVAASYMAVPSLVNEKDEVIPGTSITVMVKDNIIIRWLIIVVNALLIIVPITALVCGIIFIPWYIRKRMHLAQKRFELAEQRIDQQERDIAGEK